MLLTGVILILAIFAVIGWRKGVIRLVLSLVSMIVTILAAVIIAPLATTAIKNETNIDENMAQSIYTILSENKEVDQYFSNEQMITDGINISQAGEHLQNIRKAIMEVGDRINLPESLTDAIKAMPESELMTIINEQGQASIKEISLRIIALRLSNIILTAIIYSVKDNHWSNRHNKKTSYYKTGRQAGWSNSRPYRRTCSCVDILHSCYSHKRNRKCS